MLSRANRIYSDYPDLVKGYELNTERGLFSVIIPESTVNLVINPSFEIPASATDGYVPIPIMGTITAVSTWQAHGSYGLQISTTASTTSGVLYGDVGFTFATTTGVTYTASVTLQGEAGKMYYISFAGGGSTIGTPKMWIGTGHKQRIWVTYTETAGGNRQVQIYRDARYADNNPFYVDGLQVEAKSYPTTYCDGDQVGFVTGELAYYWNGTPHASTSTRTAQTRSGGKEVNLLEFGLHVLAIVGLGMAPLVDRSLTIPGLGEVPQETGTMAREFTIIGAVDSIAGQRNLKELRSGLIDAFKPDLTVNDQPLILRYQEYDGDDVCGESLDIICKYRGGLEGQWDNNHGERLALNFKMYLPLIQSTFSKGAALGYQTSVANADYILRRGVDGTWSILGVTFNNTVRAIVGAPDGTVLIGGQFTNVGSANGDAIVRWNGSGVSALNTGLNGTVNTIAVAPDGTVYAGGEFTDAGGVGAADYIAKWNGAAWSALGTGADNFVKSIVIGPDGTVYAGGEFTSMGGVANTAYIAKWNGAAWSALGTGANTFVNALAIGKDGSLYAGGDFTAMGGVTNTAYIAKWNGTTWSALLSGFNSTVRALTVGPDGALYAGGQFTLAGTLSMPYISKWNGSSWSGLGSGTNNYVYSLYFGNDGTLYVGGFFTTAGGVALPDRVAKWNGTSWLPLDIDLPGTPIVYAEFIGVDGIFYLGYTTTGAAISATVTISTVGSAQVYPKITFTGPGTLAQLKNYTTGKSILFNLTLLAGETAILDLNPMRMSFVSSFRGNIFNSILPGSNLDFELLPGTNNVSAFFYGTVTADTAIVISWLEQYWSLDGAAWK